MSENNYSERKFCIACGGLVPIECKCILVKIRELKEKVEKLESENKMRQDTIACIDRAYDEECEKLEKRILKIELNNKELIDKIAEIANFYYKEKKTPHKCPVCEGACHNPFFPIQMAPNFMPCKACEGKGIIWG